jgi:hypothetical protein
MGLTDIMLFIREKNLNIFSRALHAFSMADEEWRVADLLDEEQPIVADAKLAKQIVEVLGALDETNLDVRVPKAAREFAENTLSEWFEIIAEIEKKRGNIPYLINRELYQPGTDGAPDWDQGLRLEDWKQWLSDPDFMEAFYQHFHLTKLHKSTKDETPLSGYYNRIFPVKFVLRVLVAHSLISTHEISNDGAEWMEEAEQITLDELRKSALEHALYARAFLVGIDRKAGAMKNVGSEIAVGFPESNEKAKERFVAQFVGSKRKKELTGALIEMGFVNLPKFITFTIDEVHFTPAGLKFALLPNPILDDGGTGWLEYVQSGKRFSDDEVKFLLDHFRQNVPAEWGLMQAMHSAIRSGNNRPKSLDELLAIRYDIVPTQASQLRNGVVSRMEEMMLITRTKEGREVRYEVTDLAETMFG